MPSAKVFVGKAPVGVCPSGGGRGDRTGYIPGYAGVGYDVSGMLPGSGAMPSGSSVVSNVGCAAGVSVAREGRGINGVCPTGKVEPGRIGLSPSGWGYEVMGRVAVDGETGGTPGADNEDVTGEDTSPITPPAGS